MIFFHLTQPFLFCSATFFTYVSLTLTPRFLSFIYDDHPFYCTFFPISVCHTLITLFGADKHTMYAILSLSFFILLFLPCGVVHVQYHPGDPPILHIRGIRTFYDPPYTYTTAPDTTFQNIPDMNKASETCVACHISM